MTTPSRETLTDILGADFWTVGFTTADDAQRQATYRMSEGREAVTWEDADGHHWCAYGVRSAEAVAQSNAVLTSALAEGVGIVEALHRMAGITDRG